MARRAPRGRIFRPSSAHWAPASMAPHSQGVLSDMPHPVDPSVSPERRRTLVLLVNSVVAVIGGALSGLLGVFALKPAAAPAKDRWIRAGALSDLEPHVPAATRARRPTRRRLVPRTRAGDRLPRMGRRQAGPRDVGDLHPSRMSGPLGSPRARSFRCPCHGGVYDVTGKVVEGPPPRPLDVLDARIDTGEDSVLVRL